MDISLEKNQIIMFGKPSKYDSFVKKMSDLSGEQIFSFIETRGIALPRKMNCLAMISVLNEKIKFLHSESLSKDYFTRLQYYKGFTETQLVNLFKTICDDEDYAKYRYNICDLIIKNFKILEINDGECQYLKNLKKQKKETFEEYAYHISGCSLEMGGTFDGCDINELKKDLAFTATNQEIISIAAKYGVIIPERLTKEDYQEFILYYLSKDGELSDEEKNQLDEMTIAGLSTFARRRGIPMQPSMSKDEIVTYLFYYLEQCEIQISSITEFIADITPLEFTVDLGSINPFGNSEAKKIIHYEGEEADLEKMNQILEEYNTPKEEEIVEEENDNVSVDDEFSNLPPVGKVDVAPISIWDNQEEAKEEEKPIEEASNNQDDTQEEPKEDNVEAPEELTEESTDEEIDAYFKKKALEDEKKDETPVDPNNLNVHGVIKNDLYGSNKLKDLGKPPFKIIFISIGCAILVAIAVLIIVGSFR